MINTLNISRILSNTVFIQRLSQAFTGLVTMFLIARYLSPDLQGWYYTFTSISAVYTLFDLGLSVVLVQLSAHLFSRLSWISLGRIEGIQSEGFLKLTHQSVRFYVRLALLYLLIITPLGTVFFSYKALDFASIIQWISPWISLVIFTALNILTLPFMAVIEGSGKVKEVYFLRTIQNLLGSVCLWLALIFGYKLFALSMLPAVSFLAVLVWLIYSKPYLLEISFARSSENFHWKHEVWPLQWRVGLSWIAGYLLTQIYTPILFHFDSAKVAGQMGLSLTIANMLGLLAQSWIARRVPDMGKSVANKDWDTFDRVFKHDFYISLLMYSVGGVALCLFALVLNHETGYGERILPIVPFIGLLIVVFVNHITGALASHLRSYKKEPLVMVSLISTLITIPIALYGASTFSATGVVAAILFVQILFTLPMTVYYWLKFNREWRVE